MPPRLQVLNHRCAQFQDEQGVWNKYGGRLSWDQRAIVGACVAPGAVIVALQGLLGCAGVAGFGRGPACGCRVNHSYMPNTMLTHHACCLRIPFALAR